MITRPHDPALPVIFPSGQTFDGLTKRELFAALICAGDAESVFPEDAVKIADALIVALNKTAENP